MTFAGYMVGLVLAFFVFFPKSAGRHCAEFVQAYRAANQKDPAP